MVLTIPQSFGLLSCEGEDLRVHWNIITKEQVLSCDAFSEGKHMNLVYYCICAVSQNIPQKKTCMCCHVVDDNWHMYNMYIIWNYANPPTQKAPPAVDRSYVVVFVGPAKSLRGSYRTGSPRGSGPRVCVAHTLHATRSVTEQCTVPKTYDWFNIPSWSTTENCLIFNRRYNFKLVKEKVYLAPAHQLETPSEPKWHLFVATCLKPFKETSSSGISSVTIKLLTSPRRRAYQTWGTKTSHKTVKHTRMMPTWPCIPYTKMSGEPSHDCSFSVSIWGSICSILNCQTPPKLHANLICLTSSHTLDFRTFFGTVSLRASQYVINQQGSEPAQGGI